MTTVIQVLPLPNNKKLTDKTTDVNSLTYDNSNPSYTPNGTYIATSSSYCGPGNKAYNIFNGTTTDKWICDFFQNPDYNENTFANPKYTQNPYTGETPSTYQGGGNTKTKYITTIGNGYNASNHYGEWVQIQLPYKIYLYRYSLLTPSLPSGVNSFPKKFIVAGSNDGNTWDIIHMRDYKKIPECNGSPIIYNLNTINSYSYFRLVVTEVADRQTIASISQWNVFGTIRQTKNKEMFSNIQENFYGMSHVTGGATTIEGAATITSPNISIGGPYADKYIDGTCADENGNSTYTDYQTSIDALRRNYPKCQGLTKETHYEKITPPSTCAIMTMPGLVTTDDVKVGSGSLSLDGTPVQYVTLPPIQTANSGLTIALWFKSNNSGTWARLFDIGNGPNKDNILLAINDNRLIAWTPRDSKWVSNTKINNNAWHHVAWTMSAGENNASGTWKFYLDGSLVNSSSGVLPPAVTRTKGYLGKSNWDNDPNFNGKIAEFRIYHNELSSDDVSYLYKFPNLQGYDDIDETKYDAIKAPYLYYSFDMSTITKGTGINSINAPVIKKSIHYTLRQTGNLMNFSDTTYGTKVNSVDSRGEPVQKWVGNVSAWNTTKSTAESFHTIADISNTEIGPLNKASVDYNTLLAKINTRYNDISGNVRLITNEKGSGVRDILMADERYDYAGGKLNVIHKKPELQDGMKEDSITMLSQQNSVFILGTICSTALLILAITLASE